MILGCCVLSNSAPCNKKKRVFLSVSSAGFRPQRHSVCLPPLHTRPKCVRTHCCCLAAVPNKPCDAMRLVVHKQRQPSLAHNCILQQLTGRLLNEADLRASQAGHQSHTTTLNNVAQILLHCGHTQHARAPAGNLPLGADAAAAAAPICVVR